MAQTTLPRSLKESLLRMESGLKRKPLDLNPYTTFDLNLTGIF